MKTREKFSEIRQRLAATGVADQAAAQFADDVMGQLQAAEQWADAYYKEQNPGDVDEVALNDFTDEFVRRVLSRCNLVLKGSFNDDAAATVSEFDKAFKSQAPGPKRSRAKAKKEDGRPTPPRAVGTGAPVDMSDDVPAPSLEDI